MLPLSLHIPPNCLQPELHHLQSFRGSDLTLIQTAKLYFESLSQSPSLFLTRILALLNLETIPNDETNLVLVMLRNLLLQRGRELKEQEILEALDFVTTRFLGDKGVRGMIETIIILLKLVPTEALLHQTIEAMIRILESSPSIKILSLLAQTLDSPVIGQSKLLPFSGHNFKQLPLPNIPGYHVHFGLFLLRIASNFNTMRLTMEETFEIFKLSPVQTSDYIIRTVLPDLNPDSIFPILAFLTQQVFSQSTTFNEETITSINQLFHRVILSSDPICTPGCSIVTETHFCCYFSWLVVNFELYHKRVTENEIEQDHTAIKMIFGKLEAYNVGLINLRHVINNVVKQVAQQVTHGRLDQVKKEGGYFILTKFMDVVLEETSLPHLIASARASSSPGCLLFLFEVVQHSKSKFLDRRQLNCDLESLLPIRSPLSLSIIIRTIFLSSKLITHSTLTNLIASIDIFHEQQQFDFYTLLLKLFQTITVDEDIFQIVKNVTDQFNNCRGCLKVVFLELWAVVARRYFFNLLDFSDMWEHVQKFRVEEAQIDVFCRMLTEMIKVYNREVYRIDGFPEYCERVFLLFWRKWSIYELAMEIINLPSCCFKLLQRFRDTLIESLEEGNQRLLDVLEVFIILYPVSSEEYCDRVLAKLKGLSYYRFYFRFRPQLPPKAVECEVNDPIYLKWIVLSYLVRCEKSKNCSESRQEIGVLMHNFQGLGLGMSEREYLDQWINKLRQTLDNNHHWIGEWRNNLVKTVIRRDFKQLSKQSILKRYESLE